MINIVIIYLCIGVVVDMLLTIFTWDEVQGTDVFWEYQLLNFLIGVFWLPLFIIKAIEAMVEEIRNKLNARK